METLKPKEHENESLTGLADDLEKIMQKKTDGEGNWAMQKWIDILRVRNVYTAKVFLDNEMDKFDWYREDAVPMIIEKLYGGSGSPWFSIEKKIKQKQKG